MMKFFRKHNKKLLAIFMAALMIVFIGGSALEGWLTPRADRVVGNSRYGDVSLVDQQYALEHTRFLDVLGLDWRRPVGGAAKPLEEIDWILLQREAQELGMGVDAAAASASAAFAPVMERLESAARRNRVRPQVIQQAIAEFRSVQMAAVAVAGAATPSEAELAIAARDALEKVQVRTVLLPAKAFIDKEASFGEAEIQAQFATYREKEAGEGLDFGYYRHPSLQVQYIKIDRDVLADTIGVANLERKAKTYYEEHKEKDLPFRRKPQDMPNPDPYTQGILPGPPPEPSKYLEWDEAKEIAIAALRKQYANEAAERIANWVIQYATDSWVQIERGPDGYKVAPANVARPEYYAEMLDRLPPSMSFPDAVSVETTEFFTAKEAGGVAEVGAASFRPERGTEQRFGALVFRTKVIVPQVPEDKGTNPGEYLAPFQTCPYPLTDSKSGSLYVFRVVDGRAGQPAELLDEVRDQVLADLQLLRGYQVAKVRADSLRSCVSPDTGLREAYEGDADLVAFKAGGEGAESGYFDPAPFSRAHRGQAARGRPTGGMFVGVGVGNLPNDVVDACFALETADEKTKMLELPNRATIMLVEWVETQRAPEDDFNQLRQQLVTQLADARWRAAINEWLDPQQIRARTGFSFLTN